MLGYTILMFLAFFEAFELRVGPWVGATGVGDLKMVWWMLEATSKHEKYSEHFRSHNWVGDAVGAFKKVGWMLAIGSKHEYHGEDIRSHTLVGAPVTGAFKKVWWMLEVEYIQEYDSEDFRCHTFVGFVVGFEVATRQLFA